ncbi:Flagellar hook-associated protein 3 [Gammaproteobacteria bacterium]|nr:flagellar hook-associated protein FlgL [Gammaproteobacteria bacterium]CAG0938431.1 Flagellar hook-associated protein 3 [Gammaproteobacteria bacterium]
MRVSSKSIQVQWLADVYRRQAAMARIQKQVSSGLRINTAGDDPGGASQVVSLKQGLGRLENFQASGEAVRRRLSLEEGALSNVQDALARVRELAVEAGGGVQTNDTRKAIAAEIRELLAGMVDSANSQDGEGRYLFGGNAVAGQPVTLSGGVAVYNGDDGVRLQRVGENRSLREGDAGSDVFFRIRNGNGSFSVTGNAGNQGTAFFSAATVTDPSSWVADDYTVSFTGPGAWTVTDSGGATIASGSWQTGDAIQFRGISVTFNGAPAAGDSFSIAASDHDSIFAMVDRLAGALESDSASPRGRAAFQTRLNAVLLDLDQAERHLDDVRSGVGSRLAAVDEQKSNNDELALQLQTTLSSVRDVDYPKAISDLETQLTGLEAAQKVFAQTRSLSLFDLL